ncbi:MAG: c-type cytochrome [Sulfitobacter sp.]|uniref:c-type cytochrome n=1 Tax=Alphaproteobacteria TaxID=28211 RepID=UPI002AC8A93C|nr:c-type cytochrome [Sulfitobacter sp. OXR-159]WPZ31641.1 c-type cytochrome [Sulfitobacter sp. OXR-159]
MPPLKTSLALLAAFGTVLAACSAPSMPEAPDGAKFYVENCVACHGMSAKGDGPLASTLDAAPTDLTLLARENGGMFPRARALSYVYGHPEQRELARDMPQFGGSMAHDTVPVEINGILTPTPRELAGLLVYLESIQR